MKIAETGTAGATLSPKLKEHAKEVLQLAIEISDTRKLFQEIREMSELLQDLVWSEEENQAKDEAIEYFDASMQAMVYFTIRNLEAYQRSTWMELFPRGGDADGSERSV
jgi:hypothetical protein